MKKFILTAIIFLLGVPQYMFANSSESPYLIIKNNQVALNIGTILTTRGNAVYSDWSLSCQKFFKKNPKKTICYTYKIIESNQYYGIIEREKLGKQELISKTVFMYVFSTGEFIDITNTLDQNYGIMNFWNFFLSSNWSQLFIQVWWTQKANTTSGSAVFSGQKINGKSDKLEIERLLLDSVISKSPLVTCDTSGNCR